MSKKIYDAMMNLSVQVGELEIENKDLGGQVENLTLQYTAAKAAIQKLVEKRDQMEGDLLKYETATWIDRLRYFFTGKIGGME